jgi:hypothetical protein
MTPDSFRKLALTLPESSESEHMDHPDFRVGKKIFATLSYPDASLAMVKLTPAQQRRYVASHPKVFTPVPGGWGLRGATHIRLKSATRQLLWPALMDAWRNIAPLTLGRKHDALGR